MGNEPHTSRMPTVLVVEDDDSARLVLVSMLHRLDVRVRTARDGREALEVARGDPPDLVLLDLMLPNLNGFQFLRAFREQEGRETPVVIASSRSEALDRFWAGKLRAAEYIQKPFTFQQISRVIEEHVRSCFKEDPGAPVRP